MGLAFARYGTVVLVTLAYLPVAAGVAAALARMRQLRGLPRGWAWRASLAEVGMVVGTVPWLWMILTPRPGPRTLHLVPLAILGPQLTGGARTAVAQIGGNLLVFAAFGFCAPVRWRVGPAAVLGLAAAASIGIEGLQYVLDIGRDTATDDVLVNALGAGLAALCSRPWWRTRRPDTRTDRSPRRPARFTSGGGGI